MAVDLKQLSARLKLSPTTVSRALNGYTDVSEATRARVAQMAAELGYQPNLTARRLATGRADAIGIVYALESADLGDYHFQEVLAALSDRADEAGFDLLLVSAREKTELRSYERLVRGRRVDGLIVARTRVHDARLDYLLGTRVPFVAYGRSANCDQFPWFDFDNAAGTQIAVEQLVALGHRQIGYVHAPLTLNFAHQRHSGFLRAMQAAGLEVLPGWAISAGMNRRNGYAATQRLLQLPQRPTAIIVDNHLCGAGVVRSLLDSGVAIGRDMSVVMYDGVPTDTLLLGQKIAAVEQPTPAATGRTLGEMLFALIEGRPLAEPHVLRQPVFVTGTSVGPPPG